MNRALVSFLRSALLAAALAPPAHAYVRTKTQSGLDLFWGTRGHTFQMDALGTPDLSDNSAC